MYPIIFRFASELRWGEAWRWSKGQIRQNSIFGYFSSVAALLILMKIDSKQVFKVVHKFIFFYLGYSKGCAWWKYKDQIRQNSILDFSATTLLILMKLGLPFIGSKQVIISTNVNTRPILAPLGTHFVTSMSPISKI